MSADFAGSNAAFVEHRCCFADKNKETELDNFAKKTNGGSRRRSRRCGSIRKPCEDL